MKTLDDRVVVASTGTPHRRFSAVAAFFDNALDGADAEDQRYWLADPSGGGVELPAELWGLLRDAAQMLAGEGGVSLAAVPATLDLQSAADFASVPLPTLLQCVADGSIPLAEDLTAAPSRSDESDTVALKDVVALREYMERQRLAANDQLSQLAPISPVVAPVSSPAVAPAPRSVPPVSAPPVVVAPVSVEPVSPIAVSPSSISAEWEEYARAIQQPAPSSPAYGYGAAPETPPVVSASPGGWGAGGQGVEEQAQTTTRVVAHASVRTSIRPPISAPAVRVATSGWGENPNPGLNHPTSAAPSHQVPPPVSVPQTWYTANRD